MAEVSQWRPLSRNVAILRLKSHKGERFPDYQPGQSIVLSRSGVSMIYSIASAPYQTKQRGYLEFFVNRENEFLRGERIQYADRAAGDFTLDRAKDFANVVFVASGTGVAPFVSMIREVSHEGTAGIRYTLIHGSRKFEELGYYRELSELAAAGNIDFLYIPTVSRPNAGAWNQTTIGRGRAANLLRLLVHSSLKGEAILPAPLWKQDFRERFHARSTIILACGSHLSVADVKNVATEKGIRFEKEDW
jgi:ferredoxin-NADP reductase